jgi:hypothetical protein
MAQCKRADEPKIEKSDDEYCGIGRELVDT